MLLRKVKLYYGDSLKRNSVRRIVTVAEWWLLEQDLVAGADLDSYYKTGSRWIGGRWSRTGICWCRKVVADSGLVAAGVGRWSLIQNWYLLVQEGGRWFRTGSCWCKTGSCWCRKVDAGAGLVAASAGKWSPVQEWYLLLQGSGRRCKKVTTGAVSKGIRLDFLN